MLYVYNALGQQVIRRLPQDQSVIHSLFDLAGNRIAEYEVDPLTNAKTLAREYIWMDSVPVAVVENGQLYFVRTDHIGRPVFATNSAGAKVWDATYLPFGGVHTTTGDPINLRFPGQWFQSEAGLHQNWMRDYDPTTGRYVQADPLGLVDGASVYGYVRQNPGRYVDPRGEELVPVPLPDGTTEMRWVPGGANNCPSGECVSRPSTENIRDDWPEFDQCVKECLNSEPMLDPSSWWPVPQSSRAQCAIISAVTGKLFSLPFPGGRVVTSGCRRDICEAKCVSCEK